MKQTFILYKDMNTFVQSMTDEQVGKLMKAVYKYAINGEHTTFKDKFVDSTYTFICKKMDSATSKYDAKCLKNKENAKKRWDKNESGGMRSHANAKKSMLTDTDTDTDTDTSNKKSNTKVLPKKVGSRFDFKKHVNDKWLVEAKRLRNDFNDNDIQEQMAIFSDYWKGVAGVKGVKLDWIATWRNWIRRADKKSRYSGNSKKFNVNAWINGDKQ